MKIIMRILFQEDAKPRLLDTGVFSDEEMDAVVLELDAQSERFMQFLEATKDVSGSWFNPIMQFSKKELNGARFFQLQCRKTLPENDRDMKWNDEHVESLVYITTSAGRKIRLPNRIAVSKTAPLKPNMVAGIGQSLAEFVVHREVANQFAVEGLTGLSIRPVFHSKTAAVHEDVVQLYTDSIMPRAELDKTTPPADGGGVRQIGCLTYADLDASTLSDFNRTAEDWSSGDMPIWVVSENVRQSFQHNKYKGWAFQPVLEVGTSLHDEYERQWSHVFESVAINPQNFF